jgi:hypothetical protein
MNTLPMIMGGGSVRVRWRWAVMFKLSFTSRRSRVPLQATRRRAGLHFVHNEYRDPGWSLPHPRGNRWRGDSKTNDRRPTIMKFLVVCLIAVVICLWCSPRFSSYSGALRRRGRTSRKHRTYRLV